MVLVATRATKEGGTMTEPQVPEGATPLAEPTATEVDREVGAEPTEPTDGGFQGLGGQPTDSRDAPTAPPKVAPATEPRYVEPFAGLADRVKVARVAVGSRNKLAELLGQTGSAVWRHEHDRTHPAELADLLEDLAAIEDRIAAGEFAKPSDPAASRLSTVLSAAGEALSIIEEVNRLNKNKSLAGLLVKAAGILSSTK